MLPNHHEAAWHLAVRRRTEAERSARDSARVREVRDQVARSVGPSGLAPRSGADTRACPPPCPSPARGVIG